MIAPSTTPFAKQQQQLHGRRQNITTTDNTYNHNGYHFMSLSTIWFAFEILMRITTHNPKNPTHYPINDHEHPYNILQSRITSSKNIASMHRFCGDPNSIFITIILVVLSPKYGSYQYVNKCIHYVKVK